MRIRYFVLGDDDTTLHRVPKRRIEAAWDQKRSWLEDARDLSIVTVLADDLFRPVVCALTRVRVEDGRITEESQQRAAYAWKLIGKKFLDKRRGPVAEPDAACQLNDWPSELELKRQIAVALDVPLGQVPDLVIGGPLVAAVHLRVSVRQAYAYYEHLFA